MSERTDHLTDDTITLFLRTRSTDAQPSLLDDIVRTVGATPQDRPWLGLRPILLPRRTVLIVAMALLLVTMGAIAVGSRFLQPDLSVSPFEGTWVSTSDTDGGSQTMTVRVSDDGAVEIVVLDDIATVCSGTPSTMTGAGRIEGGTQLVIPAPVYTCDDGSVAETLSGPPLEEQLRDWTLSHDPPTDTLTGSSGGLWAREGAELPSPDPTVMISDTMWPQTSLEQVREAQELADAWDPRYTWQVDAVLASDTTLYPWDSEIVERFVREGLGWEDWGVGRSGVFSGQSGGPYDELMLIRCAPGQTNPLYPEMPADVRGCAPTIDDFRYETARIDLGQPGLRGPSGIWVVTGWEMLQPVEPGTFYEHLYPHFELGQVEQVAPPSDAEITTLVQAFLGARVDGEGAERYVHRHRDGWDDQEAPIMYATTGGSPYERYEMDRLQGPVWPTGWIEFRVRLFAEDGTVVEQSFIVVRQEDGRLGLMYGLPFDRDVFPSTEDGQAVPVPYSFLDGEVTFEAAPPWGEGGGDAAGSLFLDLDRSWMRIAADPLPVQSGCGPGPAPADAGELAQSIRSDPDLEATAPVAVSIGGIDALRIDVALAAEAGCVQGDGPAVVVEKSWLGDGNRMRLYLLDLPGGPGRTLTIAILASRPDFEQVVEAAAPVLDSLEFHAR